MAQTITVSLGERSYPIHIGENLLHLIPEMLQKSGIRGSIGVITDTHVAELYLQQTISFLKEAAFPCVTHILPAGEESKQLSRIEEICGTFLEGRLDRASAVVALGGGVVGDIAGFAAACFMRGIPFIQVPTTIVAQVDSSVGGKTAVNHALGKNTIGCFHQPCGVVIDMTVLKTLPPRELRAGCAEIIKHGVILDAGLFNYMEKEAASVLAYDLKALFYPVARSCEIKSAVVAEDEKEHGIRALLNFGHTFGHALAACVPTLSHGQAIAKGMVMAAAYSVTKGLLPAEDLQRLSGLLNSCGLDTALPCPEREIIPYMLHDKKKRNRDLKLVLLGDIGKYELVSEPVEKWLNRSRNPGVSLGKNINKNVAYWIDAAPWIELRLDMMEDLSPVGMVALRMQCMGKEKKLLLTYPVAAGRQDIPDILSEMISWGPGWVDIPLDAGADYQRQLTELARENGVQVIHSAHFWKDPTVEGVDEGLLDTLAEKAFSSGADFLKIAVYSDTPQQSDILLSWCDKQNECVETAFRITVMIMGGDALRARKHALLNGYPFVYAAPAYNETTAPGQPSFQELAG